MWGIPKRTRAGAAVIAVVLLCGVLGPAPALASRTQIPIMQDDVALGFSPGRALQEMRHLGVTMVRYTVRWSYIAPDATSHKRPSFNATDPNAYPPNNWTPYDALVRGAAAAGIKVMFVPTASAPFWAQGPGAPPRAGGAYQIDQAWEPSAREFGEFMQALGTRYSGRFSPPYLHGQPLPRVSIWELYNEPNFGEDLAPQAIKGSSVLWAPVMFRSLLNAAWSGLRVSGHGSDTRLVGALAARGDRIIVHGGSGLPGVYGETTPLEFIRDLYCVDAQYHPYRGPAAKVRKCPSTASATRRFRAQNPGLFSASGWSIHPYPLTRDASAPPNTTRYHNPNYVALSQIPNMARTLDRIQRIYGSGKRFPIWNTEYGYITNPPNADRNNPNVSLVTQAFYDNWAEYLQWRNPRIVSTMQYLLVDPNPSVGTPECGGFASGLIFYGAPPTTSGCSSYVPGQLKPGVAAYRLPIFLPQASGRRGQALKVWGCIRPAHFALADGKGPQTAAIQFQAGSSGAWTTVATVTMRNPAASCYFNTPVRFPSSGSVRLSWQYPAADAGLLPTFGVGQYFDPLQPVTSRTVTVAIH